MNEQIPDRQCLYKFLVRYLSLRRHILHFYQGWENPSLMIESHIWDFPGGPVVETTPSNAEDTGSIPGWGTKMPHATGQLSLHLATTEPGILEPVLHN